MANRKSTIDNIRNLVGQGKIDTAFNLLDKLQMDKEDRDFLLTLRHNFNNKKAAYQVEEISEEEYSRSNARTAEGILRFVQRLEQDPAVKKGRFATVKMVGLGLLVCVLVFVFWKTFLISPVDQQPAPGSIQNTTQGDQSPIILGDSIQLQYNNDSSDDTQKE